MILARVLMCLMRAETFPREKGKELMNLSMFAPLRDRSYRMLFAGQIFSDFGNWLDVIALTVLLVYRWGLGPEAVATLMITIAIPNVLLGPILSVWADRLPTRTLMILCDLSRALLVIGFVFAPSFYILLPLVFLRAAMGAMFYPARQAAVRKLVPEDKLTEAISLSELVTRGSQILAPMLGGLAMTLASPQSVFWVEAVFMLISAAFLSRLPEMRNVAAAPGQAKKESNFWAEFKEGLQHVKKSRLLLLAMAFMTITLFIVFFFDGLLSVWTRELELGESGLGLIISGIGTGMVLGTVLVGQWNSWKHNPMRTMAAAAVLMGLLTIVVGLGGLGIVSWYAILWAILFALIGMGAATINVPFGYVLQTETPVELIGRVSGVLNAVSSGAMLLSPALAAALAKVVGIGPVFVGSGIVMAVFALTVLLFSGRMAPAPKVSAEGTAVGQ